MDGKMFGAFVVTSIIVIGIFLAFREFFCWYWKINQMVDLLRENNALMRVNMQLPAAPVVDFASYGQMKPLPSIAEAGDDELAVVPGAIKRWDGKIKLLEDCDVPYGAKSIYDEWEASPDDSGIWSRFVKSFARQIPNLIHGEGAAAAYGQYFPKAMSNPDFVKLIARLED